MLKSDGDPEKAKEIYAKSQERQNENDKIILDVAIDGSRAAPVKDLVEIGMEAAKGGHTVDKALEVTAGDVASNAVESALDGKIGSGAASLAGAIAGKAVGEAAGAALAERREENSNVPKSSQGINTRDKR